MATSRLRPRAVGTALYDGVEGQQRVAGEVHLGDEPRQEAAPEHREVHVGGTPRVVVVPPGIRARPDRREPEPPVRVRDHPAGPAEIRIERGVVRIQRVGVAAGGVRLPDLDQRLGDGPGVVVQHAAGDDDALADAAGRGAAGSGRRRCGPTRP